MAMTSEIRKRIMFVDSGSLYSIFGGGHQPHRVTG